MKKHFFILFVCTTISSFAQTDFSTIKMEKDSDYKTAEKYALEASNYVLSVPLDSKNSKRNAAIKFLAQWMEGTPDYSYGMQLEVTDKLNTENEGLLGVYFAGMTKFSLEYPTKAEDPQLIMVSGLKTLLAYAEKPENKITQSDTLKKLNELNKSGELDKLFK